MAVSAVSAASSASSARNQAAKDADRAADSAAAQLEFEKEQYAEQKERWDATYGSVEENLADYYTNMTSDYYAVQGVEAFQAEQQAALTTVRETLAQRGLATSGTAAATEIASAVSQASGRAAIRAEAETKVNEQKLGFLSVGMGVKPTTAGISNALTNQTSVASQTATNSSNTAATQSAAAAQAVGAAAQAIATGLTDTTDTTTAEG
jgi:hypothetical protein